MKKGFTLIEIIISIALIMIIGTSATVVVINNQKNETETITKKLLDSAKVYLETAEIDDGGIRLLMTHI